MCIRDRLKGVRAGLLPASCRDAALRAAQAVRNHIGPDGLVGQVSYGTIVADTLEYYKNVPLRPTGYGQNLADVYKRQSMNGA